MSKEINQNIKVLSNKDKARQRINVFHGSANNYINMTKELIGNSFDVFDSSITNTIKIIIHDKNKIEYIDSALGIPVEGIASDGSANYEAIFEKDFAGSRYENDAATIGQNGIFLYTLTMTSQDIEYYIARPNGKLYNVQYHKGDRVKDLSIIGKESETYSRIIFSLDGDVWNNPSFTFEEIKNICKSQASLANVKIILEDKQSNNTEEFYYENGIEDYFNEITSEKSLVTESIRITEEKVQNIKKLNCGEETELKDNIKVDLLFSYSNDSTEDIQKEFLNTADLLLHGTIQEGIYNGLKYSIDKWLKGNNKYNKNEKSISLDDISTGLNYICNVSSLYVEYDNQIKQRTSVKHYKDVLKDMIINHLEVLFIENPLLATKLCTQILINKQSREKAEKTRLDIKKKLSTTSNGTMSVKIEGLKDCDMRNSTLEERIILVNEGLSANATITDAIDSRTMGTYPLRGRFISSLKNSVEDVLNNKPAMGIISALGCGIEIPKEEKKKFKDVNLFDITKLRYGKVGILCDSDAFGRGINLSIITFFYKFMPELLKQGRLYLIKSPRYEITTKDKTYFAYNEEEKQVLIDDLESKKVKFSIGIKKGLGEFDKDQFYEFVLSPENRRFQQITYIENQKDMIEHYFNMLMGEDIESRKKYIQEKVVNINIEELD